MMFVPHCLTEVTFETAPVSVFIAKQETALTPEARFATVAKSVERGRNFQNSIDALLALRPRFTGQSTYHNVLACAYLSRAASLFQAAFSLPLYHSQRAKYEQVRQGWETAQKDKTSPLYGLPAPVAPELRTLDDNKVFTLSRDVAEQEVRALVEESLQEWNKAIVAATTPDEQRASRFARAWGLLLIYRYTQEYGLKQTKTPDLAEVTKEFSFIAEQSPNNALYWQALGDAYLKGRSVGKQSDSTAQAVNAYGRAVTVQPNNTPLLLRLSTLYGTTSEVKEEQTALSLLQKAARTSGNAYLWYRLAYKHLQLTKASTGQGGTDSGEKAVNCLREGNKAGVYTFPLYKLATPRLLQSAWSYVSNGLDLLYASPEMYRLPSAMESYAYKLIDSAPESAVEAATLVTQMGLRVSKVAEEQSFTSAPTQNFNTAQATLLFTWGEMAALTGRRALTQVYTKQGRREQAVQARKDFGVLKIKLSGREAALKQSQYARQRGS